MRTNAEKVSSVATNDIPATKCTLPFTEHTHTHTKISCWLSLDAGKEKERERETPQKRMVGRMDGWIGERAEMQSPCLSTWHFERHFVGKKEPFLACHSSLVRVVRVNTCPHVTLCKSLNASTGVCSDRPNTWVMAFCIALY